MKNIFIVKIFFIDDQHIIKLFDCEENRKYKNKKLKMSSVSNISEDKFIYLLISYIIFYFLKNKCIK